MKKEHLNPKCDGHVYVELPEGAGAPPGRCGKLRSRLYGFRPAAAAWEKHYSALLEGEGFVRGMSCGVVFYHPDRDVRCVVHGDNFTILGHTEQLDWFRDRSKAKFEVKCKASLGSKPEVLLRVLLSCHFNRNRLLIAKRLLAVVSTRMCVYVFDIMISL